MTREQYYEMAENFAKYANLEVQYKSFNTYYGYGYGELSKYKYNQKSGTLRGVGIGGNTEHFILQMQYGGLTAIHYRHIKFPNA